MRHVSLPLRIIRRGHRLDAGTPGQHLLVCQPAKGGDPLYTHRIEGKGHQTISITRCRLAI